MRREIRTEAFLRNLPLFRGLDEQELARLADGTTQRRLARGELLFREGEPSTGIHAVVYGRIKLATATPQGRDRLVDWVGPGQSFGEAVMFLGKRYIVTATALADSLVLQVAKDVVHAELARNPRLAEQIIGALAGRIESLVHEVRDYGLSTATERLVAWLLRREADPAAGGVTVTLPATKRALAARLHLSAEHLSRVLHELGDEGLIRVRGREVAIPDVDRLKAWQRHSAATPPAADRP